MLTARLALICGLCMAAVAWGEEKTLVVRDTIGRAWENEPITWTVSFKAGEWDGRDLLLERDGKPLVAQANVKEKHADGSAKTAEVLCIIDRLDAGGATTLRLTPGKKGPLAAEVWLKHGDGFQILTSRLAGVKLRERADGAAGPILQVRLPSDRWVGGSRYATTTAKPTDMKLDFIEEGPLRIAATATTTFDNGRRHVVTVTVTAGSRSIEVEEDFNVGPDEKYHFKEYKTDRDELAWEWWSWYGDREGVNEDHPNNWFLDLSDEQYRPKHVEYYGDMSTDPDKGDIKNRGRYGYELAYGRPRRLEKFLAGHGQWRPDSVLWYATSETAEPGADCLAVYTHSARKWRNPNVYPLTKGITLRTGANDMRILSLAGGRRLTVQCPIGLGHRTWAIRPSTREETFAKTATSPTALDAEYVQRCMGLDITRTWVTDWDMTFDYPRLFIKPKDKEKYYARFRESGAGMSWGLGGFLHK